MVGNDDSLVVVGLSCLDNVLDTVVNSPNGLGNGIVNTSVTYHITIGEVNNDEVVLVLVDSCHQLVLYFISRHLRLQVVGGYLWRRNQNTILALERLLATTVEEEGDVSIFLSLGSVQLLLALTREVFTKGVFDVLFGEQDVYTSERSVVWSHAIVLQSGDGLHALFLHILLSEHNGELLGTVVTEIDEDDNVALLNQSVDRSIVDRLDKFVGNTLVIAFLHGLYHVGGLLANTLHDEVVTFLHTLPALVAVHRIETAHDRSNGSIVLFALCLHLLDESFTRTGVSVTSVHETVNESLVLQSIVLTHLDELEKMVEA